MLVPTIARHSAQRLRSITLLLAVIFAVFLSGCGTIKLSLDRGEIAAPNLQGVNVNVVVLVNNGKSYDVMIRNLRANVTMANRYPLAPIRYNPNQWLGARQITRVAVPVTIPWPQVLPLLAESMGRETIAFNVDGAADVTATRALAYEVNDKEFHETGLVPRSAILAAARTMYPNVY